MMVRATMGSPPRMRGKDVSRKRVVLLWRITPAYAGKSGTGNVYFGSNGDHPRVCGEKYTRTFMRAIVLGSPPRMRGKEPPCWLHPVGGGITPAYAGKRVH